jgi:hypothetical protein
MVGKVITLAEVVTIINSGKAFDIEYVTCDRERGTGGELKVYSQVTKSSAIPERRKGRGKKHIPDIGVTRNPNHSANHTVNIYIPGEPDRHKRIRKLHLRLITKVNGKQVL